jgi:P22_AR N-terminal domain
MSEITTIRFDGDNLQTVREGERVWVVLKRACEALGLDAATQAEKLKEKAWSVTGLIPATGNDAKTYEMFCVDLDTLPMWLATIDVGRVRPEAREKLIAYQRECARVLRDHFFGARTSSADLTVMSAIAAQVEHLTRQVAWLAQNIALGGVIAPAQLRHMRSEVKSIAALEVASGRFKSARASSADLYREMGEMASWGGKGKPWTELPAQMAPVAMAVLRVRRSTAEKVVCAPARQLRLVAHAAG